MARKFQNKRSQAPHSKRSNDQREDKRSKSHSRSRRQNAADREYDSKTQTQTGSLNDISWYSRNPQLLLAAGSFPYPYRPGMAMPLNYPNPIARAKTSPYVIPALATLDWIPSFGNSSLSTDPASVAGKEMYGRVRAAYSGALDADAPDFVVYLGALDSLFAYIGYLKRMYRCLSVYTPENLALPDVLLSGMGFTPSQATDLRKDKVRFWQGINELILQSRKFKCPAVMDLFNRHYWMSDNVYADAASLRAQLYMFTLRGVYKLTMVPEASSGDEVAGLQMIAIPRDFVELESTSANATTSSHYICDTLLEFGRDLIGALDAWDDCYTISGYLQRAYDNVQNFSVAELLQNEVVVAQFVPEVLMQIENSQGVLPADFASGDYSLIFSDITVTQDVPNNAVVSNVNLTLPNGNKGPTPERKALDLSFGTQGLPVFISSRSEAPTVADTVIATRLKPHVSYKNNAQGTTCAVKITAGTEIPLRWNLVIFSYNQDGTLGSYVSIPVPPVAMIAFPDAADPATTVSTIKPVFYGYWEQFDWHPITLLGTDAYADSGTQTVVPMGDVHNPTIASPEMIANLHKICFYSEMNSFGM